MNGRHCFRFSATQLYVLFLAVSTLFAGAPTVLMAAADSAQLEELVVTARRREESLQDTPIAVSAYSGERLEDLGITMITRLQDLTPNMVFQNTPTNSGVGSTLWCSFAVSAKGLCTHYRPRRRHLCRWGFSGAYRRVCF
jgi:hypothetical protein